MDRSVGEAEWEKSPKELQSIQFNCESWKYLSWRLRNENWVFAWFDDRVLFDDYLMSRRAISNRFAVRLGNANEVRFKSTQIDTDRYRVWKSSITFHELFPRDDEGKRMSVVLWVSFSGIISNSPRTPSLICSIRIPSPADPIGLSSVAIFAEKKFILDSSLEEKWIPWFYDSMILWFCMILFRTFSIFLYLIFWWIHFRGMKVNDES